MCLGSDNRVWCLCRPDHRHLPSCPGDSSRLITQSFTISHTLILVGDNLDDGDASDDVVVGDFGLRAIDRTQHDVHLACGWQQTSGLVPGRDGLDSQVVFPRLHRRDGVRVQPGVKDGKDGRVRAVDDAGCERVVERVGEDETGLAGDERPVGGGSSGERREGLEGQRWVGRVQGRDELRGQREGGVESERGVERLGDCGRGDIAWSAARAVGRRPGG